MTLTLREGGYYVTRDGQKMGPLVAREDSRGYVWAHAWDGVQGRIFRADGTSYASRDLDIVAEWHDPSSPVRTVTTKQIVPGTYGAVQVHERLGIDQNPYVCIENRSWDAADLRAAAATLVEIADALDGPDMAHP